MIRCLGLSFLLTIVLAVAREDKGKIPVDRPAGTIEVVATFDGPMPTGVTVSSDGRIFVNFPRWGDAVDFTVAELKDGKAVAYPDETFARFDKSRPGQTLVSVQSVVVDPSDRLWMLDTGSIEFGPPLPGGAKLVGVDLKTNRVFKTIPFPTDVALKTTYLNDIRFDLRKGKGGRGLYHRLRATRAKWHHRRGPGDGQKPPSLERSPLHEAREELPPNC